MLIAKLIPQLCGISVSHKYSFLKWTSSRIFVIGPSHHVYAEKMCISGASRMDTPFGSLMVDEAIRSELVASGMFDMMSKEMDEDEHSLEMQLPFIAYAANELDEVTVIPMVTGTT